MIAIRACMTVLFIPVRTSRFEMRPETVLNRDNLVQCIACKLWVLPHERLRANFVGGYNLRFNVCLDCMKAHKEGRKCIACGAPLTAQNAALRRNKAGRLYMHRSKCLSCWEADYRAERVRRKHEYAIRPK